MGSARALQPRGYRPGSGRRALATAEVVSSPGAPHCPPPSFSSAPSARGQTTRRPEDHTVPRRPGGVPGRLGGPAGARARQVYRERGGSAPGCRLRAARACRDPVVLTGGEAEGRVFMMLNRKGRDLSHALAVFDGVRRQGWNIAREQEAIRQGAPLGGPPSRSGRLRRV